MVQIARFITTSRGDLFDMTRRLIGAVEGGILQDPDNPLLLTVRGSHSSGKKIIADECRMVIFHQCQMSGQQDFDEYYTGTYNGQKRALHYIDAAWGTGYSNPQLDDPSDKKAMNAFMSARQGVDGITILQNPGDFAADKGIGFFVENKRDTVDYQLPHYRRHGAVRSAFNQAAHGNDWARYVEVEVRDERLLASEKFRRAFAAFAPVEKDPLPRTFKEIVKALVTRRPAPLVLDYARDIAPVPVGP